MQRGITVEQCIIISVGEIQCGYKGPVFWSGTHTRIMVVTMNSSTLLGVPPGVRPSDFLDSDIINGLLATKYLAAAGLVCMLWDYLLTLSDEIKFFWKAKKWDFTRVIFFLVRYPNQAGLLYSAYIFSGLRPALTDHQCKGFLVTEGCLGIFAIGLANVYMVLRHYTLWDRRKAAKYALWGAFTVTYLAVVVLFFLTLVSIWSHAYFNTYVQTCLIRKKPKFLIGAWAAMTAFDIFTILLAITNALDQPYREPVDVLKRFRRDGAMFFMSLFCLRLIHLICSVVLPTEELLLDLFLVWSMVSIVHCRLMLRVESIKGRVSGNGMPAIYPMYELDSWGIRGL